METEPMPSGEPIAQPEPQPEPLPEGEQELFLEHLKDEVEEAAREMGVELSAEELRAAWRGPHTPDEKWAPFKLGEREAKLSVRAIDSPEDSDARRRYGAQSLMIRAAGLLRSAPQTAAECLQYARDVWAGKYAWNEQDIPQAGRSVGRGEEEEDMRKAA